MRLNMEKVKSKITIGNKLKQARLSIGLTQEQVSEKIGCAPRYIGQLESNQTMGSIPLILKLCNLYNVTLNDLYSDYLDIPAEKDLTKISGYFNLNNEHKSIVENSISFLNKLEN